MTAYDEPATPAGVGGLVRFRLDLCYDGGNFAGWSRQPGLRTVQGEVEAAFARVLRGETPRLTVAGRTDAGVHARGQVVHVDLPPIEAATVARGLNALLPADVRILGLAAAPPGFDARFSALSRCYRYRVTDAPYGAQPLRRHDTLAHRRPLDVAAMATSAATMLGLRDFAAYCKRREGATTVRELLRLDVQRTGECVEITAEADAFCHSMVRSLVGALLAVGDGRRPLGWPAALLAAGSRRAVVAPAHGLTLLAVRYPPDGDLAARAGLARRLRVAAPAEPPAGME